MAKPLAIDAKGILILHKNFAKVSLDKVDVDRSDLGDLEEVHFCALYDWVAKYDGKYPIVGRHLQDNDEEVEAKLAIGRKVSMEKKKQRLIAELGGKALTPEQLKQVQAAQSAQQGADAVASGALTMSQAGAEPTSKTLLGSDLVVDLAKGKSAASSGVGAAQENVPEFTFDAETRDSKADEAIRCVSEDAPFAFAVDNFLSEPECKALQKAMLRRHEGKTFGTKMRVSMEPSVKTDAQSVEEDKLLRFVEERVEEFTVPVEFRETYDKRRHSEDPMMGMLTLPGAGGGGSVDSTSGENGQLHLGAHVDPYKRRFLVERKDTVLDSFPFRLRPIRGEIDKIRCTRSSVGEKSQYFG